MKSKILNFLLIMAFIATVSSCTTVNKSMKSPNTLVELSKSDFDLSAQVSAEANSTKIIGVDWSRLHMKKSADISNSSSSISSVSIPIIGGMIGDKTANYALYELMNANQGYDVVFYPQYETKVEKPILGIGFLMKNTKVTARARLGKLKN